jgi:hypothetical protein
MPASLFVDLQFTTLNLCSPSEGAEVGEFDPAPVSGFGARVPRIDPATMLEGTRRLSLWHRAGSAYF